jgi:hypothetical protein
MLTPERFSPTNDRTTAVIAWHGRLECPTNLPPGVL